MKSAELKLGQPGEPKTAMILKRAREAGIKVVDMGALPEMPGRNFEKEFAALVRNAARFGDSELAFCVRVALYCAEDDAAEIRNDDDAEFWEVAYRGIALTQDYACDSQVQAWFKEFCYEG